ncbi:MAG TPA: BamA/TamA family outer membrane protein, partial [Gemmatimonadales bacterium]|nr:BamA/TamA family outer membrane protein [Gemmatimonadales bacterium]
MTPHRRSTLRRWAALAAAVPFLSAAPAAARQAVPALDTVTVVPNAEYEAGGLHRFFFGTRYRQLWTTPIRVPVLDLSRYGGGLTPTERGGGLQTKSLRFKGGDGKEYQFRSVVKDPTSVLPPDLRETFAAELLRDQMSSGHPAGAVVVPPLLEAAGVLHATPVLVQMPDDPRLGEHRGDFAGLLGTIEERPRGMDEGVAFAGASDVVGSDGLYNRLNRNPAVRVDSRAFLLARLTDIFLGDWDRHRDQWRWALIERGGRRSWQPIPRDRDQAFVRFDGFMLSQARRQAPQLLNFGPDYGDMVGATWNGRDLDRRLLTDLERPVFDSMAALLQSRLTDQVITDAVGRLPQEFRPLDAERLAATLRARRDRLGEAAVKYYELLAGRVDVWGTDEDDEARVVRNADGKTEVTLSAGGNAYFHRRFDPRETGEVRIYLQGGGDRTTVSGESRGSPTVRVVGGGGDDRYSLTARSGVRLYDDRGDNLAEGGRINRKLWRPKVDTTVEYPHPPRDWGSKTLTTPMLLFGPDLGVVAGWGGFTRWFGFRRVPAATRADYWLAYSTEKKSGRIRLGLTRYGENSPRMFTIEALASGIEILRWYGFGNETVASTQTEFHRLSQNQLSLSLGWGLRWNDGDEFLIGPMVMWSDTDLSDEPNSTRFIALDAPYGTGEFGMAGLKASLRLEGRDVPKFATRGGRLEIEGRYVPKWWDVDEAFGSVRAEASVALSPGGSWKPTLNFLAGGVKTWGAVPFFEAPYLGGYRTLRGYRPNRFAGEASAYGSAELRLPLTRIKFIVPGQQGLFGFGDAGRVWVDGESSDEVHTSFGGGLWMSFAGRGNVLVVGVGAPSETVGGDKGARVFAGFG